MKQNKYHYCQHTSPMTMTTFLQDSITGVTL